MLQSINHNIPASGAIVAEEKAFLWKLEKTPRDTDISVSSPSYHVPRRFKGIWQPNTVETDNIIKEAIRIVEDRGIEIIAFLDGSGRVLNV